METDPFSRREALHTASVLADMIERHLADHPFIAGTPDLKARADSIVGAINDLYQAIGAAG